METLQALWADPATQTVFWTLIGVLLAKAVYPLLQKLVLKTETKTDDEFLASIEDMINAAIAKKTTKAKTPTAPTAE